MKHVYYIMVISIILNGWFLLERVEWMILLSDVLMSESINENTYTYILNQFASTLTFNKQPSHKQLLRLIYDLSLKYVLF